MRVTNIVNDAPILFGPLVVQYQPYRNANLHRYDLQNRTLNKVPPPPPTVQKTIGKPTGACRKRVPGGGGQNYKHHGRRMYRSNVSERQKKKKKPRTKAGRAVLQLERSSNSLYYYCDYRCDYVDYYYDIVRTASDGIGVLYTRKCF